VRKTLLIALVVLLVPGLPVVALAAWSTSSTVNNPICTATGRQDHPQIVSDGAGGAIITWQSYHSTTNYDIYAQWVDSLGNAQWTANGTAICTAADRQDNPQIVSDGAGGAVITWEDHRSTTVDDIYAQRVDFGGNTLWTNNGTAICTEGTTQQEPQLVSDGAHGAVITWTDNRHQQDDIYAQRVDALGNTPSAPRITIRIHPSSSPTAPAAPSSPGRTTAATTTTSTPSWWTPVAIPSGRPTGRPSAP